MGYQTWRDDFVARLARLGATTADARYLLRQATTLQRLAEAQCNGDWPADNGERPTAPCDACGALWAPSVLTRWRRPVVPLAPGWCDGTLDAAEMRAAQPALFVDEPQPARSASRRVCPDCRAGWRVCAYLADRMPGWGCDFAGDPRGAVLAVFPPAGPECAHAEADRQSGRCGHVIGVPTR